jgi:tRNA A-37 threonylcarbamoyl transferase component Bud32
MPTEIVGQKGRYVVESEIGSGGVAAVYRARSAVTKQVCAVKILHEIADEDTRLRFQQEARLGETFENPHVVRVLDHGQHEHRDFLVMELVEGDSLAALSKQGALRLDDSVSIAAEVARALHALHGHGIVHRDVKPHNVIVAKDGRAVLTDFGFAKDTTSKFQLTGEYVVGTPAYMAPEQIQGKTSPSVDIYALGVLLYQLATGVLPFHADTPDETFQLVLRVVPAPPRRYVRNMSRALEAIILQCLEKTPERRFPTALALAEALEVVVVERPYTEPSFFGRRSGFQLALLALVPAAVTATVFGTWFVLAARKASRPPPVVAPPAPPPKPQHPGAAPLAAARDLALRGESPEAVRVQLERALLLEPGYVEATLELVSLDLGSGALDAAQRELDGLDPNKVDEKTRDLVETQRRRLAEEAKLESDLIERTKVGLRDFRIRESLESLEAAAKDHPRSARVQKSLALAKGLAGNAAEALAAEKRALALDEGVGAAFPPRLRQGLEHTNGPAAPLPAGLSPLSSSWERFLGGTWGERDAVIVGSNDGVGEFEFAGLVRGDAPSSPRYKASVELALESGSPGAYAGILFGAKSPDDFYCAYIFFDRHDLDRMSEEEVAEFQKKTGAYPKFLRIAHMGGLQWRCLTQKTLAFPDKGFVHLSVEAKGGATLKVTINDEAIEGDLDRDLGGRVGLLKWYDTAVRFRNWSWTGGQ